MRGTHSEQRRRPATIAGSSPRVRGTRPSATPTMRVPVHPRACGERGPPAIVQRPGHAVHPRACGERFRLGDCVGSSPRVRGTLDSAVRAAVSRFIPARAGNAATRSDPVSRRRFIPARAGNARSSNCRNACCYGSSPRVRGTRHDERGRQLPERFIPARAGNADDRAVTRRYDDGSSPRVRGTRGAERGDHGTTPVHPRACGERAGLDGRDRSPHRFIPARAGNAPLRCTVSQLVAGSSPRVRGTLSRLISGSWRYPVHPRACGERADARGHGIRLDTVHPRACGERACRGITRQQVNGSSPRVRGTLIGTDDANDCNRFIPARAGNALRLSVCAKEEFTMSNSAPTFHFSSVLERG